MSKLIDPITTANLEAATNYQKGYRQGQRDQAPAAVILSAICGVTGVLVGGGIVGALVAIF